MLTKTEIFHQLNDMILVPKFQEVHQLAKIKEIDNDENIRIIILRGKYNVLLQSQYLNFYLPKKELNNHELDINKTYKF